MNYGNKIFVYEGIPDIYFTAFLSTDLMSGVTLRRYLLPDIMDNGNFKGFFPPFNDEINTSTHAHTKVNRMENNNLLTELISIVN